MKILIVSQTYKDSYPPRYLSMGSAVKQSENLSLNNQILVLTTGREKSFEKVNSNLEVVSFKGWLLPDPINYVISFDLLIQFTGYAKKFKPDVVLVSKFMFFSSLVIPIARLLGLKVITTTDTFPGINWFPRNRFVGLVMAIYARLVGLPLLWLSNKVVIFYEGLVPIANRYHLNYQLIHNGVDSKYLQTNLVPPKDLHKQSGERWIGFVGRFESVKGFDIALKLAEAFQADKTVKFIFIGGDRPVGDYPNCLFLGYRYDIANIYQLFDILIIPSYSEGLPNVAMEAMAQGVCVLASRVGGLDGLITHLKTGYLVDGVDVVNFSFALHHLLNQKSLLNKLALSGQKHVEAKYNWQKILDEYNSMMRDVLSK